MTATLILAAGGIAAFVASLRLYQPPPPPTVVVVTPASLPSVTPAPATPGIMPVVIVTMTPTPLTVAQKQATAGSVATQTAVADRIAVATLQAIPPLCPTDADTVCIWPDATSTPVPTSTPIPVCETPVPGARCVMKAEG